MKKIYESPISEEIAFHNEGLMQTFTQQETENASGSDDRSTGKAEVGGAAGEGETPAKSVNWDLWEF